MIKHIIWDFDGTLFDTYPAISRAFLNALEDFGHHYPLEKIAVLSRQTFSRCIEEMCTLFGMDRDAYTDHFQNYYSGMDPADQPPFAGAREVCVYINEIGGKNFIVTHRGKSGALALLEYYGMGRLFADCIYGGDGYPKKPDPAAFNYLIETHHLPLDHTLVVGDRRLDIEAGRSAGAVACFFSPAGKISRSADINFSDYGVLFSEIKKINHG